MRLLGKLTQTLNTHTARSVTSRAAAGLAFVLVAAVLSVPLRPWLEYVPSTLFFVAVLLASWYAGRIGGLTATATAVVAMDYVLFQPLYSLAPNPAYVPSILVFAASAVAIANLTAARRRAETTLHNLNATLEERVRDRTAELIHANAQLRAEIERRTAAEEELAASQQRLLESNRNLEEFASIASHDLQEPLRTITAFSQLLERRYSNELPEDGTRLLAGVVESSRRMARLLEDLLAYARAERADEPPADVSLAAVVEHVRENLNSAIDESEARLTCDWLPVVRGNRAQLTQLVQNLIANSVKYRSEAPPRVPVTR